MYRKEQPELWFDRLKELTIFISNMEIKSSMLWFDRLKELTILPTPVEIKAILLWFDRLKELTILHLHQGEASRCCGLIDLRN